MIADLLIGVSYVVISATLVFIVRRAGRDLPYQGFFWAFGLFIVSCGVTHFFEILTVWKPVYWLSAAAKRRGDESGWCRARFQQYADGAFRFG